MVLSSNPCRERLVHWTTVTKDFHIFLVISHINLVKGWRIHTLRVIEFVVIEKCKY